ncbi:MATE family efflux transporter [Portibacter marinus]|uniref:polysaccharide biosynthesis C-terminal domain-containing protein n=1 Tax=Portibacter marinus TaxID=2898660 RepID=UPI001F1C4376|nr:polysaccharide biosynthesis C-terminal domain-containing protein [Portibacter marinus]
MKWLENVSALQFFHTMRFGTLILIGIILVKSGFEPSEIGLYELFFFISNVVSFFWVMGLNNGLMSYYPKLSREKQKSLLFNLGLLLVSLALIASTALLLFEPLIARLAGSNSGDIQYMHWIIAYMVLSAPGNFTEYYLLLKNKPVRILRYGLILFGLQIVLIGYGVHNGYTILGLLQLMVLWAAIKFIWFWVIALRYGRPSLDFKLQMVFLSFSFPLIFHMLLGNGMEYVDGFLVTYFFDSEVFAQFRYGARELPLLTVLVGAISTALIPIAVNDMSGALSQVKKKITRLSNFIFPISVVLMLTSTFLFSFFYSESYKLSARIFNVYLLVISSRILMPQVIVFSRHHNMILMLSAGVELLVNFIFSLLFLRYFGIIGIAWATVLAYLINKIILMVFAWRKYKIQPGVYLNIKVYGGWLLLLVSSYYISTFY